MSVSREALHFFESLRETNFLWKIAFSLLRQLNPCKNRSSRYRQCIGSTGLNAHSQKAVSLSGRRQSVRRPSPNSFLALSAKRFALSEPSKRVISAFGTQQPPSSSNDTFVSSTSSNASCTVMDSTRLSRVCPVLSLCDVSSMHP